MDGQTSTYPRPSSWNEDEEAFERSEAIGTAWDRAGIPKRYREVEPFDGEVDWAYLEGCVGAGKTYMACQMLRAYIERHTRRLSAEIPVFSTPKVYFTTAHDYLEGLKQGYDEHDATNRYKGCDLLVLDDLGQERPTQWAVEQLFAIINHRYNEELPIIVTSQFPLGGIAKRLAEEGGREQAQAIASRLLGCCTYYRLTARDRRLQ